MSIGIIGAGTLGSNVARLLAKNGISATIANHRGPQSLANLVEELGSSIKTRTLEETAKTDIVLVALRWVDLPKALGGLPAWSYFPVDLGLLDVGAPLTSLPLGSLGSINFIKI